MAAVRRPFVVLTSNATRELSEALKRRCLYLHLDYPDAEREREIVSRQVPDLDDRIAEPARRHRRPGCASSSSRRRRRSPSRSTGRAPWSRSRSATSTTKTIADTLGVVLKHASDHDRAIRELRLRTGHDASRRARRPPHRLRRGAARRPACRSRSPRTSTPSPRSARCRWHERETVRAGTPPRWSSGSRAAPDLRRALRPLLPARSSATASATTRARRRAAGRSATTPRPLAAFRERLAEALPGRRPGARCRSWRSRRWPGSARCRAGRPGCRAGRRTRRCSGSTPTAWSGQIVAALLRARARRRRGAARGRRAGSARSPGSSRTTPAAGSRRRRGPTTSPTSRSGRAIDRLDFTAARRADLEEMRREIYPLARRLATRLTQEHHARAARPARLPAYGPRLDLHRRRPDHHPSPAEAAAPHRAGRAVRRQRLGRQLRPVHAAAGLRAARPVHQGPRVHVRRPRPRGHPPLPARAPTSPT